MPLLIIARLTLREAVRRRLLLAAVILTVLIVGLITWGLSRLVTFSPRGQPVSHSEVLMSTAFLIIMLAYMFSMVLAVGAAFLAAPAIAGDVESGIVLAMLPRPIRRSDFVLGKWLGLAVLLGLYAAGAGGLLLLTVRMVTGYVAPHPFLALLFLVGEAVVLMTLALLCSTRLAPMTGGIIAIVLFGVAWLAGIVTAVGSVFGNTTITTAGTVISLILPTDGLWRGVAYNLQPAIVVALLRSGNEAAGNPFAATAPPTTPYVIWAIAWLVVVLGVAALRFSRRDL